MASDEGRRAVVGAREGYTLGLQIFDEKRPRNASLTIEDTDSGDWQQLMAPDFGTWVRVDGITITSTDTVARVVSFSLGQPVTGETSWGLIGSVSVPAGAGDGTVPPLDVLPLILPAGLSGIVLDGQYSLSVKMPTAPATGKTLTITLWGGFI